LQCNTIAPGKIQRAAFYNGIFVPWGIAYCIPRVYIEHAIVTVRHWCAGRGQCKNARRIIERGLLSRGFRHAEDFFMKRHCAARARLLSIFGALATLH
jgi:hypothetical protein